MKIERVVEELYKPARRNYQRRQVKILGLDETWQADLVDMREYVRENKGFKYMLTVIDVFSKFAWAIPLKSKRGEDVTNAMKSILRQGCIPQNLHTDKGKEFYNKNFKHLMNDYGINLYSTHSNLKASICERFSRTLKNEMWMRFSLRGSFRWLNVLHDLVDKYNNTKHRTIGMKPKDVST